MSSYTPPTTPRKDLEQIIRLTNCSLCDEGRLISNRDLYINKTTGKIISAPNSSAQFIESVDMEGLIVSPGFLDIQINGCFGLDFCSTDDSETFLRNYDMAMKEYIKTGVTSICPTLPSTFNHIYAKNLPVLKANRRNDQTESLGAHCEGPFLSPLKRGCHPPAALREAAQGFQSFEMMYDGSMDCIKIITAAPELTGVLSAIKGITEDKKITFSIGHTMSNYATGLLAVEQGASMITHLYNAMPLFHHREPGVIGLISSPELRDADRLPYYGVVADGIHVHPAAIASAYTSNPEKMFLVTDAMHLIGLGNGEYYWENDQYIVKEGYHLFLKGTDTIAGSATDLGSCLRNSMKWLNLSLPEAVKLVTNNPANSIGVESTKGYLKPGCDADLTILDSNGFVKQVFKLGEKLYDCTGAGK